MWYRLDDVPGGPISRHVACALGESRMVVHSFRSSEHVAVLDAATGSFREQPTAGDAPKSLGFHCGAMLDGPEGPTLVVYGGGDKDTSTGFQSDAFALSCTGDVWRWRRLRTEGLRPAALGAACATRIGGRVMAVFGGAEMPGDFAEGRGLRARSRVWTLSLGADGASAEWALVVDDGLDDQLGSLENVPAPRIASTVVNLPPHVADETVRGHLLVQGGWRPEDAHTFEGARVLELSE